MARSLAVLVAFCLHAVSAEFWNVGKLISSVDRRMEGSMLRLPLRVYPYEITGIDGKSCTKKNATECPAYITQNIRLTRRVVTNGDGASFVGMVHYTLGIEKELTKAVERSGGVDPQDKTICKLFWLMNDNNSLPVKKAIDTGDLILDKIPAEHEVQISTSHPLTHSDLWISSIVLCDNIRYTPLPIGTYYTATGGVTYMAPTGHLSSLHYSYLLFHKWNAVVLLMLLTGWVVFCVIRRDHATKVHGTLAAMVVISVFEQFAMWLFLREVNHSGGDALGERYFAIVVEALRKILWCFLLLLLVHGYRTLHPSLKESRIGEILGLTLVYTMVCAASFTYDPRDTLNQKSVEGVQSTVTFFLYIYVINRLATTIEKLKEEKQRTKEKLYRNLFNLIAGYIAASFVYLVILIAVYSTTSRATLESSWRGWWALYGSDAILFETLLVLLMVLWRPSESSSRLLYSIELGADDDDMPGPDEDIFAGLDENNEAAVPTGNPLSHLGTAAAEVPRDGNEPETDAVVPSVVVSSEEGEVDIVAQPERPAKGKLD